MTLLHNLLSREMLTCCEDANRLAAHRGRRVDRLGRSRSDHRQEEGASSTQKFESNDDADYVVSHTEHHEARSGRVRRCRGVFLLPSSHASSFLIRLTRFSIIKRPSRAPTSSALSSLPSSSTATRSAPTSSASASSTLSRSSPGSRSPSPARSGPSRTRRTSRSSSRAGARRARC